MGASYLERPEADSEYGGQTGHIYQGHLFQAVEFMVPHADGTWGDKIWDAIVVSHDCEYTKIAEKPTKPLLIAPVRLLSDYQQREQILEGGAYGLWALRQEGPLGDDAYVVDFRLIQPIAVQQLQDAKHWTCLGPELREQLAVRLELFLFRGRLADA